MRSAPAALLTLAAGVVLAVQSSAVAMPAAADPLCHADAATSITDYISDHTEVMSRQGCDSDVAIYFDADLAALPAAQTSWVAPFVGDVWRHLKATYGACAVARTLPAPIGPGCENFGSPKPLLAFLHEGKHGGGTLATRFDGFAGFRSTIDVGDDGWSVTSGVLHDRIVHEACHQVEGASQGVQESPAYGEIWGDSKWAEFCIYDFYARTGRSADAQRVANDWTAARDNLPTGATNAAWFRDWFLPLWQGDGGDGAVMQRFFGLLSQYFPTRSTNDGRNLIYTRRMTAGEFVHFSSAAAGADLSTRAAAAFNSGFSRTSFEQAQRDFPQVRYPGFTGTSPCGPAALVAVNTNDNKLYRWGVTNPVSSAFGTGQAVGAEWSGIRLTASDTAEGALFAVDSAGYMRRYLFNGSTYTGGAVIGQGWGGTTQLAAQGNGIIYAKDSAGALRWYRWSGSAWASGSGTIIGTGWAALNIVGGGNGVVYAVRPSDGALLWYRHASPTTPATTWSGPTVIGSGWATMRQVTSIGGGHLYAVRATGTLVHFQHLGHATGTAQWVSGSGADVGPGWLPYDRLTAGPTACA